jgi:hypothetical protein
MAPPLEAEKNRCGSDIRQAFFPRKKQSNCVGFEVVLRRRGDGEVRSFKLQ